MESKINEIKEYSLGAISGFFIGVLLTFAIMTVVWGIHDTYVYGPLLGYYGNSNGEAVRSREAGMSIFINYEEDEKALIGYQNHSSSSTKANGTWDFIIVTIPDRDAAVRYREQMLKFLDEMMMNPKYFYED